jgi:hypothetical protein
MVYGSTGGEDNKGYSGERWTEEKRKHVEVANPPPIAGTCPKNDTIAITLDAGCTGSAEKPVKMTLWIAHTRGTRWQRATSWE